MCVYKYAESLTLARLRGIRFGMLSAKRPYCVHFLPCLEAMSFGQRHASLTH